jgi:hypothetical protein
MCASALRSFIRSTFVPIGWWSVPHVTSPCRTTSSLATNCRVPLAIGVVSLARCCDYHLAYLRLFLAGCERVHAVLFCTQNADGKERHKREECHNRLVTCSQCDVLDRFPGIPFRYAVNSLATCRCFWRCIPRCVQATCFVCARRFMEEHLRYYCGGRRVNCHGCGKAMTFNNIVHHVQNECETAEYLRAGGLISSEGHSAGDMPLNSPNATSVTAHTEVTLSPSAGFGTTATGGVIFGNRKANVSSPGKPKQSYLHRVDTGDLDAFKSRESPVQVHGVQNSSLALGGQVVPFAAVDDISVEGGSVSTRSGSSSDDDAAAVPSFTVKTTNKEAVEARVRNAPVVSLQFDFDHGPGTKQAAPSSGAQFGGIRPGKSMGTAVYFGAAGGGKTLSNPVAFSSGTQPAKSSWAADGSVSASGGLSFGGGLTSFPESDETPVSSGMATLTRNPSLHELLSLLPPVQEDRADDISGSGGVHDTLDTLVVSPASQSGTALAPLQKRPILGRGEKLPQLDVGVGRSPSSGPGKEPKSVVRAEGDLVTRTGLRGAGEIVGANRQFHVISG